MTVNIDDNSQSYGSLGRTDTNGEESEEHALRTIGEKQAVESREIQIDTVQYQLNRDEHGYEVAACDETKNTDEEQQSAENKEIFYLYHFVSSLSLLLPSS